MPIQMRTGQLWECRNGACGCEVLVVARSEVKSRLVPRCSCGGLMRKAYAKPELGASVNRAQVHKNEVPVRLHTASARIFFPK
jgi:hypothetical protein